MPSINMIAARRVEKRRQEQNIRRLVYAIAAEVGVTLVIVSVMTLRLVSANGRTADLKNEVAKLEPTVGRIQAMQKQTQEMQPKVATLDGAKADTLFWYDNFYALTSCLPAQAWLTALGTSGSSADGGPGTVGGGDPALSISGSAPSQAVVGTAILRMNQSPGLDHVDLASVTQQDTAVKGGKASMVSFQMTVHLKPEAAPAAPNKAGADKGAGDVQKS